MRGIEISRFGGPDVLRVVEREDPKPAAGEVRVRVRAAGLNFADVMARQGLYPDAPKPPCIVGYEASGVIDAIGEGVDTGALPAGHPFHGKKLEVGTRVVAMTRFGGQADVVCVPLGQVLPIPEGLGFEEAAAIPVVYITAYHALFNVANVKPGETVLVHSAAGGVGIAALQLCKTVPNVTVFGTASASKHDAIRAQGCAHPIDYRTQDYAVEVMRITENKGVHIVLDALGGNDWTKGYALLRSPGRLVCYGLANAAGGETRNLLRAGWQIFRSPKFGPMDLMDKNRMVAGINVGHLWEEQATLLPALSHLVQLAGEGKIKPLIDSTFPFEKAGEAHKRLTERKNVGKVMFVSS